VPSEAARHRLRPVPLLLVRVPSCPRPWGVPAWRPLETVSGSSWACPQPQGSDGVSTLGPGYRDRSRCRIGSCSLRRRPVFPARRVCGSRVVRRRCADATSPPGGLPPPRGRTWCAAPRVSPPWDAPPRCHPCVVASGRSRRRRRHDPASTGSPPRSCPSRNRDRFGVPVGAGSLGVRAVTAGGVVPDPLGVDVLGAQRFVPRVRRFGVGVPVRLGVGIGRRRAHRVLGQGAQHRARIPVPGVGGHRRCAVGPVLLGAAGARCCLRPGQAPPGPARPSAPRRR